MESFSSPSPRRSRRSCRNICIRAVVVLIGIAVLLVILVFTVFKPRDPIITVNSTAIRDLSISVDPARLGFYLKLTLESNVTVNNPNKVGAVYESGSAVLYYRGEVVGESHVPAGNIQAEESKSMKVSVVVMAERLLPEILLYSDVLPLNIYPKLSCKVAVLIFKAHVDSTLSCDLAIHLPAGTVAYIKCRSHYKV